MDRTQEMMELRFTEMWTLERIAVKYGISRERVRQIVGNSGRLASEKQHQIFDENKHLSNSTLSEMMGIAIPALYHYRDGERHDVDGGWKQVGADIENSVSEKLQSLGIENVLMPHNHTFDILLSNGKRVDVKSSGPMKISKTTPAYGFNTGTYRKGTYCDFLILVLRDVDEYFVVPIDEAAGIIRFCWPEPSRGRKSKWRQYHNHFDLLKG